MENTITGDLIRVSMESLKLEIGVQCSIFDLNSDVYSHFTTDC